MKIDKRQGIWLVFAILFILFFLNFASAQTCYCNSCADCNANLSDPACTEVRLTANITNFVGTCINNPSGFNNKVFDCQGYKIDGDDSGTDYGIYLYSKQNNTIKNCIITDFYDGIHLEYSSNNTLINNNVSSNTYRGICLLYSCLNNQIINSTTNSNAYHGIHLYSSPNNIIINLTSNSNSQYGIYLFSSSNNTIINSSLIDNTIYDFYISPGSNSDCNNRLENIIGTDNKPIVYYNETININGWNNNFTELVLCNADYSIINNVNLTHISKKNNGILLSRTDYSNLTNIFVNNSYYGIFLHSSSNNTIINSTFNSNSQHGIYFVSSSNNQIINSTTNSNNVYGIHFSSSSNNTIINSTTNSNSQHGIYLFSSPNTTIINSTFNSNSQRGIHLSSNPNTTIINSTFNSNAYGIYLYSSSNNTIHSNIITNNTQYGIYLSSSSNNTIYNNFFNNTKNFYFEGTNINNWNTTKTERTNIVEGPYIGGNYWALPNGTGFSQTCTDADEDGICDNAYNLTTNNVDYLPLKYIPPCIISFLNIKPTNNSLFDLPQINFYCEIYNSGSRRAGCAINTIKLEVNNSANENVADYFENLSDIFDYNFSHKETFNYSDTYYFSCIVKNKINQTFASEPYKIRIFINYEKLFNIKMIYAIILFVILSIAFIFFYLSMHYKEQTPIATGFLFLGFIFLIADLIGGIIILKEVGALTETLSGFLSVVTYAVGIIFVLLFMIVLIFGIVRAIKLTKKKKIRDWGLLLEDEE